MPKKSQTNTINSKVHVKNDGVPRLPSERDEAPDKQSIMPRKVMKQAYTDLEQGLVDTDLHGQRGVEEVLKKNVAQDPMKSK